MKMVKNNKYFIPISIILGFVIFGFFYCITELVKIKKVGIQENELTNKSVELKNSNKLVNQNRLNDCNKTAYQSDKDEVISYCKRTKQESLGDNCRLTLVFEKFLDDKLRADLESCTKLYDN